MKFAHQKQILSHSPENQPNGCAFLWSIFPQFHKLRNSRKLFEKVFSTVDFLQNE